MTPEELITEQSQRHHAAIQQITQVMGQTQLDVKQTQGDVKRILDLLGGTIDGKPGLAHRLASVEARQEAHEKVSPEEQRSLWWRERATKVVDAVIVLLVVSILVLAAKAFILDTVKDLSAVQAPKGTMIPVERDPTIRIAFTQEPTP